MRPRLASILILGLPLLAIMSQATPAAAQGFFDWFHGEQRQRQDSWFGRRQYAPPQGNAYAEPYGQQAPAQSYSTSSGNTGRYVAYCVRLCDGRYFPMQRHANASPVQLCNAFCPASKTQVFNGSQIDGAVAHNGARYTDLDNAFVYREKIVPDCTCNGKDSFGLAKIDVANDPTLQPGDIVASGDNVKAALTAMAAAKERREASSERPALRGSSSRRLASRPRAAAPTDQDERPED